MIFNLSGNKLQGAFDIAGNQVHGAFDIAGNTIENKKSGYAQDGLVLWLDGEWNCGEGEHSDSLHIWKDLSDEGNDFILSGTGCNAKSVSFNGSNSYGYSSSMQLRELLQKANNRDFTIELVFKMNSSSAPQVIFLGYGNTGLSADGYGLWYRASSNGFCISTAPRSAKVAESKLSDIQSVTLDSSVELYQNLNRIETQSSGGTMANLSYVTVGGRYYGASDKYSLNGEIYCIRVYDRVLSCAERINNFLIDRQRFDMHVPEILTAMSFNINYWQGINSNEVLMNSIFNAYDPDIAAFQEYASGAKLGTQSSDAYLASRWPSYKVGVPTNVVWTKAVASKYTLTGDITVPFKDDEDNDCSPSYEPRNYQKMYITVAGKRIAVYNTHLSQTGQRNASNRQYKHLQAQILANEIERSMEDEPYFIILGDFNIRCSANSPGDYDNMILPFINLGCNCANGGNLGFINTYTNQSTWNDVLTDDASGMWLPCDQIITSANIDILKVTADKRKVDHNSGGIIDHLPIIATLNIR